MEESRPEGAASVRRNFHIPRILGLWEEELVSSESWGSTPECLWAERGLFGQL